MLVSLSLNCVPFQVSKAGFKAYISAPPEIRLASDFALNCVKLCNVCFEDQSSISNALAFLGLDFSVIIIGDNSRIAMVAGFRNSFPIYYKYSAGKLEIGDSVQRVTTTESLLDTTNRVWLINFIASAWTSGPFEINPSINSINNNWLRVPGGHCYISGPSSGCTFAFDNIFNQLESDPPPPQSAANILRVSIDEHLNELNKLGAITTEFSGGIDSGIIFSRSHSLFNSKFTGGICYDYSHYEFQRERKYRRDICEHVGAAVLNLDSVDLFPFSMLGSVPSHTEPSIGSTSWGQFNASNTSARQLGASVVLNGHGGDVLFLIDPRTRVEFSGLAHFGIPKWVPRNLLAEFIEFAESTAEYLNCSCAASGVGGSWHPSMFEPSFLPQYSNIGGVPMRYTSGLVSRDSLRAALQLWRSKPQLNLFVQKPMAHYAFRDDLPATVWQRHGKVNHLANVYRGVRQAAKQISEITERCSGVLDLIGIPKKKFLNFTDEVVNGRDSGNSFFSQVFAILLWVDKNSSSGTASDNSSGFADNVFTEDTVTRPKISSRQK